MRVGIRRFIILFSLLLWTFGNVYNKKMFFKLPSHHRISGATVNLVSTTTCLNFPGFRNFRDTTGDRHIHSRRLKSDEEGQKKKKKSFYLTRIFPNFVLRSEKHQLALKLG